MIRTLLAVWLILLHWTYSNSWPRPYDDWKNTVFYLGAGLLSLFPLFKRRGSFSEKSGKPFFWIGLYLAVCLVSIQVPHYEGSLAWARLFLWMSLLFSLAEVRREDLLFLANLSLISASLVAAMAWAVYWMQYYEFSSLPFIKNYTANFIPPIGHISYFGDFIGVHVPLATWFLVQRGHKQRSLGVLSFILLLGGAWISGTRATLLAVFVSFLFGLFLFLKTKILTLRQSALFLVAFLALLAGLALFQPSGFRTKPVLTRVTETFQAESPAPSSGGVNQPDEQKSAVGAKVPAELITGTRMLALYQSFKMFLERPFRGWGIGAFRFVYPPFSQLPKPNEDFSERSWFYHPHNELAHQAVEVGLLGLSLFLFFFVFIFMKGLNELQKNPGEGTIPVVIALCGMIFLFVSWQFSTTFLNPLIRFMTALYVAFILGKVSRSFKSAIRPMAIFCGLLLIGVTIFVGSYQLSLYSMLKGKQSIELLEKEKHLSRAVRLAPGAFDPLLAYVAWRGGHEGYPQVEREVERLLENYPHVPLVLYHAALLRIEQQRKREAIQLLEEAIQIAPAFKEGKRVLEFLSMKSK